VLLYILASLRIIQHDLNDKPVLSDEDITISTSERAERKNYFYDEVKMLLAQLPATVNLDLREQRGRITSTMR
jgi:hypothetical protein